MMIVIPMAGESKRFREAGYKGSKYELLLAGKSVFRHAVESFSYYFQSTRFVFIHGSGADAFVQTECKSLGIREYSLVNVPQPTRGQADTVQLGLEALGVQDFESIVIFNIDTFRTRFRLPPPPFLSCIDGYLEVFRGSGPNWSYVRPHPNQPGRAIETAEKEEISDLCCTGVYYFRKLGDLKKCLTGVQNTETDESSAELYVAPLYNKLIRTGASIGYYEISRDEVIFCGVPTEYEHLKDAWEN